LPRTKGTEGRKMRVDTTVTETNIHYPTDSSLLEDGVIPLPGPLESKSGMGFPAGREGLVVES